MPETRLTLLRWPPSWSTSSAPPNKSCLALAIRSIGPMIRAPCVCLSWRASRGMPAVSAEADRQFGKHLVLNVTGMIGAIASELDISWRYARGLGIMARAVGLIGHIREELERPIAPEIWVRVGDEAVQKLRADEE